MDYGVLSLFILTGNPVKSHRENALLIFFQREKYIFSSFLSPLVRSYPLGHKLSCISRFTSANISHVRWGQRNHVAESERYMVQVRSLLLDPTYKQLVTTTVAVKRWAKRVWGGTQMSNTLAAKEEWRKKRISERSDKLKPQSNMASITPLHTK